MGAAVTLAAPTVTDMVADLLDHIVETQRLAREARILPDSPEGRVLTAILGAMGGLGQVLEGVGDGLRKATEEERARVAELARALEVGVKQARIATLNLQVEKENALVRIMGETLPMFAKSLREALVISEAGWREELRRRWILGAVVLALGAVGGGYALRAWQDFEATDHIRACVAQPYVAGGRAWCELRGRAGEAVRASIAPPASGTQAAPR